METHFPTQRYFNNYTNTVSKKNFCNKGINYDCFQRCESPKQISFSGNFISRLFKSQSLKEQTYIPYEIPTEYVANVTSGLNELMGTDFQPQNLNCLVSPKELMTLLPSLKSENFILSEKSLESGIYCADFDYQTSFSDGKENIFDILNNIAEFADEYNKKTGKKFIFALTDRDSLEGLQHAIRIIASNPLKYKNVKFIPGIKMSFSHKAPTSSLGYESSDMLVYGINPFSENLIEFIETTIKKRKEMTIDFIKKVNALYPEFAYSVLEFAKQNRIKYKKDFTVSDLYQRAREYAETKGDTEIKGISKVPKDVLTEAEEILSELDKVYLGSSEKGYSAIGSKIIKNEDVNKSIKKVFDEYSTHYDPALNRVVSSDGNLYKDMIECLAKESQPPVLAICDTYYYTQYFNGEDKNNQTLAFFEELINNSKGMLVAFESVSPRYDDENNAILEQIKTFNNFLREKTNLYEVGGNFAKRYNFI